MVELRFSRAEDKRSLKRLWKESFGDSDSFMNWYFDNRYLPEYTSVVEEDGSIVSMMFAYPYHVKIRNVILPGAMMSGFATKDGYRGKGYMEWNFRALNHRMKEAGMAVSFNTPVWENGYARFGHPAVTDSCYLEGTGSGKQSECLKSLDIMKAQDRLFGVYTLFSQCYSATVSRTYSDFLLKMQDYAADGAKALAWIENGTVKAYCIYYDLEDMLQGVELAYLTEGAERKLLEGILFKSEGRKISVKLPPDSELAVPGLALRKRSQAAMGIVSIEKVLGEVINIPDITVKMIDPIGITQDEIYTFSGKKVSKTADMEMSAGDMIQFVTGYRSLRELEAEKKISVFDRVKMRRLDEKFPRLNCYMIEEY